MKGRETAKNLDDLRLSRHDSDYKITTPIGVHKSCGGCRESGRRSRPGVHLIKEQPTASEARRKLGLSKRLMDFPPFTDGALSLAASLNLNAPSDDVQESRGEPARAGDIEVELKPPGVLPSSFQTER